MVLNDNMNKMMNDQETKKLIDAIKDLQRNISTNERESAEVLYNIMEEFSKIEKSKQSESTRLIHSITKKQIASWRIMRLAAVSAAAAIIAISFIIWNNDSSQRSAKITAVYNKATETPVPTLVLGSGHKINLNKALPMSIIGKVASKITKVGVSQLAYSADSSNQTPIDMHNLIIPKGYTYSVTLPDGSLVMMNANSELSYPSRFNDENRIVHLKGEAYFDIKKDSIPFIVRTDKLSVRVYGTTFNINTQKTDLIEATLLKGSIGITLHHSPTENVMIKPNEQFILNTRTHKSELNSVVGDDYTAWMSGKFRCKGEPLEYLLIKISNWHNTTFTYKEERLKSVKINAILYNNSTIDELLKAIESTINIQFINEGGGQYTVIEKL